MFDVIVRQGVFTINGCEYLGVVVRSDTGHVCGYVGVPEGNASHGLDYSHGLVAPNGMDWSEHDRHPQPFACVSLSWAAPVDTGITYAEKGPRLSGDSRWYFGFDLASRYYSTISDPAEYAWAKVQKLANFLADIDSGSIEVAPLPHRRGSVPMPPPGQHANP